MDIVEWSGQDVGIDDNNYGTPDHMILSIEGKVYVDFRLM